jgi:ribonuclease inhibitor
MPMRSASKTYRLSGKAVQTLEQFYDEMALLFRLPAHFGRNLDALWDVLTAEVQGPVELIWEESAVSKKTLGKDYARLIALFRDVEKERGDFTVRFR